MELRWKMKGGTMTYGKRKVAVHTSVKPELLDRLEAEAHKENRTIAAIIREILTGYYSSQTKPYKLFDQSS
jgi:hypothetical protein